MMESRKSKKTRSYGDAPDHSKIDGSAENPSVQRHHTSASTNQGAPSSQSQPPLMRELNFAVLGGDGAGKSTFIRYALDLKRPATSPISSKKISLDGDTFFVNLAEVSIKEIDVVAGHIQWPKALEDQVVPHIDGFLGIYDVTELKSIRDIPKVLGESAVLLAIAYKGTLLCPRDLVCNGWSPRESESSALSNT